MLCLPNRNSGTKRTFHCSLQHNTSGEMPIFPQPPAAYAPASAPEVPVRSCVSGQTPETQEMRNTGDAGRKPQIGTLERMGINKGKGLSVPSPYFDLWLLSVEPESNKRPILFAHEQSKFSRFFGYFLSKQKVTSAPSCSRTNNLCPSVLWLLPAEPESNKRPIQFVHEQSLSFGALVISCRTRK